jgi:hypothetical protein
MRTKRIHTAFAATILAALGFGTVFAQDVPFGKEQATRQCISKRLAELIAQSNRNVTADAALNACLNDLKVEMKEKGKTECDADDYFGWLITSENNKLNGVKAYPYKPNKAFLLRCRGQAR